LREAVLDVERQTGIHFSFASQALGELRIGGYIDARDGDAFLHLLQSNLDLTVQRSGDSVVISRL
jgi:ferric-dicitrate binding protein FerR (iron transport regulator)